MITDGSAGRRVCRSTHPWGRVWLRGLVMVAQRLTAFVINRLVLLGQHQSVDHELGAAAARGWWGWRGTCDWWGWGWVRWERGGAWARG